MGVFKHPITLGIIICICVLSSLAVAGAQDYFIVPRAPGSLPDIPVTVPETNNSPSKRSTLPDIADTVTTQKTSRNVSIDLNTLNLQNSIQYDTGRSDATVASLNDEVVVAPRLPGSLPPSLQLTPPSGKTGKKSYTLPGITGNPTDKARLKSNEVTLGQPKLFRSISRNQVRNLTEKSQEQSLSERKPGSYYHVKGNLENMAWAKVYLYEKKGGFFDLYATNQQMNMLGSDFIGEDGEFRIGPIEFSEGVFYEGRDVILVLELDSPYAVAYSEVYGTIKPFRFRLETRSRLTPSQGSYSFGNLSVDLQSKKFYPARVYLRVIRGLLKEKLATEQKMRIEFRQGIEEPRYMREIGYIMMPYSP